MSRNYIDFISAYCDSWCERCAFTERCSHFAVTCAEAMCDGDFKAALELALGPAPIPGRERQKTVGQRMADAFVDDEPPQKELGDIARALDERRARLRSIRWRNRAETTRLPVIGGSGRTNDARGIPTRRFVKR